MYLMLLQILKPHILVVEQFGAVGGRLKLFNRIPLTLLKNIWGTGILTMFSPIYGMMFPME